METEARCEVGHEIGEVSETGCEGGGFGAGVGASEAGWEGGGFRDGVGQESRCSRVEGGTRFRKTVRSTRPDVRAAGFEPASASARPAGWEDGVVRAGIGVE